MELKWRAAVLGGRIGMLVEGAMPRPYSVDLRERVLSAHERSEGNAAALAARFRVAVNTVKNWVWAAKTEGRRIAKPLGRGPAPRLGVPECEVLRQLVAADNDATLAEYGAQLAARTGVNVSQPVLCVTLKRLGLRRKKRRSGRASRNAPMSPPNAPPLPSGSQASRPRPSSFSTRLASAPS
jgi:transposase